MNKKSFKEQLAAALKSAFMTALHNKFKAKRHCAKCGSETHDIRKHK